VARQRPGPLHLEFAKGKTHLMVSPDGQGGLFEPCLDDASRTVRLLLAQIDLFKTWQRVWQRALQYLDELAAAEKAGP
jgi:hypothetical protein